MNNIMINGEWQNNLSALDRGLAYGDGVFRTIRVEKRQPLLWKAQLAKLCADGARLRLDMPNEAVLNREVHTFLTAQPQDVGCLKIMLTRGISERGYRLPTQPHPTRILQASVLPTHYAHLMPQGVRVRLCQLKLASQPVLAGIKHLNRLENVLARAEWEDPDIFEGLLCDRNDCLIGGVMSNIFLLHGKILSTPDLRYAGVEGVVREQLLAAATTLGWQVKVRMLTLADLHTAQAVFLTNSLFGVVAIREIIGMRHWLSSVAWERLQQWQGWRQQL